MARPDEHQRRIEATLARLARTEMRLDQAELMLQRVTESKALLSSYPRDRDDIDRVSGTRTFGLPSRRRVR